MSLDLKDIGRLKLTLEGWAAVTAQAEATGKEKLEVVREIVHAWALEQINHNILLNEALEREGLSEATRGKGRRR